MKKILYTLGLLLILVPLKVHALPKPTNVCVYDSNNTNLGCIDGNTSNQTWGAPVWQSPVIGFHSAQASYKIVSYTFNSAVCNAGTDFTINVTLFGGYNAWLNPEVYLNSNGVRNVCAKQVVNSDSISFSCTGKASNTWYLDVDVDITRWDTSKIPINSNGEYLFNIGFYQASTHTCSLNSGDIISNQNTNTQSIIDNQNQNTNDIINNQNQNQQQTNERLDEFNKNQEEANKQLTETNDYLKDDTEPEADISELGNVQGLLPAGPVDSLLNIPFYFLSIVTSSFGGVCTPLTGNFVFDTSLTIPCFSELIYNDIPASIMVFLNLIPTTFLLIVYFKHLYKKVSRAVSLETTGDDEWGVL